MIDETEQTGAPKPFGWVGLFDDPETLLRAAERVRDAGFRKWDCHTPYPVHGLAGAMGLRPSSVPLIALTAGFVGLAAAVALTAGLSVWAYPIHVGGKSLFSLPAFVPIMFELFVLFAAFAAIGCVFVFGRLGRWRSPLHDSGVMKEVTSNRFAIVLEAGDPVFQKESARALLEAAGCHEIRPLIEGGPGVPMADSTEPHGRFGGLLWRFRPSWSPGLFKAAAGALVASAFVIPLTAVALPFIEFLNDMAAQPKGKAQMTYGRLFDPAGDGWMVDRRAPEGTLSRGGETYPYADAGNTLDVAKAIGGKIANPLPYTMENMKKGRKVFETFCITCHGARGEGDGGVVGPGRFTAPPALDAPQAREYSDGTIFHIATQGTEKMPPYAEMLDSTERWQAVQYVRVLQRAMNPKPGDLDEAKR